MTRPTVGNLYERNDEIFKVLAVYPAHEHDGKGGFTPITLVKFIVDDPMPLHIKLEKFNELYTPWDPDAK